MLNLAPKKKKKTKIETDIIIFVYPEKRERVLQILNRLDSYQIGYLLE